MDRNIRQLIDFAARQSLSCIFPVTIFAALALTRVISVPGLPRYDLILIICLFVQFLMYRSGLETRDELKVIAVFHIAGLLLELFKTHMGSWSYPEPALSKVVTVPLYSGFMYASVASYMCQAWRRLDLDLTFWPAHSLVYPLGALIYINFFSEHYIFDLRYPLIASVFILFCRTRVLFTVSGIRRAMPLSVAFVLIGFFVWIAENIGTYLSGWQYPHQVDTWRIVHSAKITSWFLLVIVSFIFVAELKHVKAKLAKQAKVVHSSTGDLPGAAPGNDASPGNLSQGQTGERDDRAEELVGQYRCTQP